MKSTCPPSLHMSTRRYVGTAVRTSPPLVMSPGLTNETIQVVTVEVDMTAPENADPKQQLEEGEFVERLVVDRRELLAELGRHSAEGSRVFAALWLFAQGMALAA